MSIVIDLDGVIWRGSQFIDGVDIALAHMRRKFDQVLYVTNNSGPTSIELLKRLRKVDVIAQESDLITSAAAVVPLLNAKDVVLVVGGEGLNEAVNLSGATIFKDENVFSIKELIPQIVDKNEWMKITAVVAGIAPNISYRQISYATLAIMNGAKFIATNDDATFPIENNLVFPGAGMTVAAIKSTTNKEPIITGKPNAAIISLISQRSQNKVEFVIGDRLSTDGELAKRLNANFIQVLSGVSKERSIEAKYVVRNIVELLNII